MPYPRNVVESTTKTAYLYAGSILVASLSGGTHSYVHEDPLGDTRLVAQKPHTSVVFFSTNYEPFGVQAAPRAATRASSTRGSGPSAVPYTPLIEQNLPLETLLHADEGFSSLGNRHNRRWGLKAI